MDIIELTHVMYPSIPLWPKEPSLEITTLATIKKDKYLLKKISFNEHHGTHFGVPAHFIAGGITAEMIPPENLVAPGVVLDIQKSCSNNKDYALTVKDIIAWEAEYGCIPSRSYVLACTGWSKKWTDHSKYFGFSHDGSMHFPGYSEKAVIFLIEERKCLGLGIDTYGIDPGVDNEFRSNYALFKRGGYHLENLTNLYLLPARDFTLFIGLIPIAGSSGSPARVIAQIGK